MGILNSATGEVLGPGFDTVIKLWIPFMVGLGFAYLTGKLVKQFLST
jgi:hypothetical protein